MTAAVSPGVLAPALATLIVCIGMRLWRGYKTTGRASWTFKAFFGIVGTLVALNTAFIVGMVALGR